ncbi:MAG: HAD-IA family hydrolase, partial [bacterium]|nr:HAD-IA family hydrolase [bacterium]
DDTLFSTTDFAKRARSNAVRAMIEAGVKLPEKDVYKELEEVIKEFSSNYDHHFDKLLMRLPQEAVTVNPALIVSAGMVAYHDTKFQGLEPFPDVKPFLRSLIGAGLRTGIITHGWTTKQSEKLIRLGLLPHLDPSAIFISDQVGISKPNPKLYALALREMGLEPPQVMFVGDNLANDVAPPKSLGMHTVWAKRAAKTGQDPEDFGPDYVVEGFRELADILRDAHGVKLAAF